MAESGINIKGAELLWWYFFFFWRLGIEGGDEGASSARGEASPASQQESSMAWWSDILNPQARKMKLWHSFRTLGSSVCLLLWFMAICCADVLYYSEGWRHTFIIYTLLLRDSRGSRMRSELKVSQEGGYFLCPLWHPSSSTVWHMNGFFALQLKYL